MDTDIRNPDQVAPVSGIEPMPDWFPANTELTIRWWTRDSHPLGIYRGTIEYSFDGTNYVVGWVGGMGWNEYTITRPDPGSLYYLRTNAEDKAGNIEPIHATPDKILHFYSRKADGQVLDVRGYGLDQARISASPTAMNAPLTNDAGSATIYFGADASHQVHFSRAGYGLTPTQTWAIHENRAFLAGLPGTDEQITNGQFNAASPLSGWTAEGTVAIGQTDGREGGDAAATISPCSNDLCITDPEVVTQAPAGELVLDSQASARVVSAAGAYFARASDGTWQSGPALPEGSYTNLVIAPDDSLFVVRSNPEVQIFHKPAGESWSALALPVTLTTPPAIQVDPTGRLHMVYTITGGDQSKYLTMVSLPNGSTTWSSPLQLDPTPVIADAQPSIAVGQDGSIHVLYRASTQYMRFVSVSSAREVSSPVVISYNYDSSIDHPKLILAPDGSLHAVARGLQKGFNNNQPFQQFRYHYWSKPIGADWSYPTMIWIGPRDINQTAIVQEWGGLAVDAYNNVYVALLDLPNVTDNVIYLRRAAGGSTWNIKKATQAGRPGSLDFFFQGRQGYLLTGGMEGLRYRWMDYSGQGGTASLSQGIVLPAQMHQPTLSFFYQIGQIIPTNASLEVLVLEDGQAPVTLLVKSGGTSDWQHVWADLSPWLGKAVTLQFRLSHPQAEYPPEIRIAEITVSSWETPVLRGISPAVVKIIPAEGVWVRIQTENWIAGSRVYLGLKEVGPLEYDPNTGDLRFWLAADTPPGRYDVRVVTPRGLDATLHAALWVKWDTISLPMIRR